MPFTSLKKPLSENRVGLLSTNEITIHHDPETEENPLKEEGFRQVYAIATDTPTEKLYSRTASFDSYATHLDDINTFFPIDRMREALVSGRYKNLPERL